MQKALNFNTLRFSVAYALALFVAGVDLSISVRAGKDLTGNSLGGTAAYVLIALGTIIAARAGAPQLQSIGPKRVYIGAALICVSSGISTSYASYAHIPGLFYLGMLLIGIFMGLSNFHRLLVKDYSDSPNSWDTSIVLLSGIFGSLLGPWAAGSIAHSSAEFYKAYAMVVLIGFLTLVISLMLPSCVKMPRRRNYPLNSRNDRPTLYIGGVTGMLGYVVMTLMMTAIPLEAQNHGMGSNKIAQLTEFHMVAMYLPIVLVPLLLARYRPRDIAIWSLGLGGFGAFCVLVGSHVEYISLAILMVIAGVIWAFSYTSASNMVAGSHFGRSNPSARGRIEMMPPLGMVLGSILAGLLLEYADFLWVVIAFILIPVMTLPILISMGRAISKASTYE